MSATRTFNQIRTPASITYMWLDSSKGPVESQAYPIEFSNKLTDDFAARLATVLETKKFFTISLNPGKPDIRIANAKEIICTIGQTLQQPSYTIPYLSNVSVCFKGREAAVGISLQNDPQEVKKNVQDELERGKPVTLLTDQYTRTLIFRMEDVREIIISAFEQSKAYWVLESDN